MHVVHLFRYINFFSCAPSMVEDRGGGAKKKEASERSNYFERILTVEHFFDRLINISGH